MKKTCLPVLAVIFSLAMVLGCAPEEKAKTEERAAGGAPATTTFVTIGTGAVTGVYYPTGAAIARLVNRKRAQYGIRAAVESTAGSVFNVNAVLSGNLEFGLAQSDRQYEAVNGLGEWQQQGRQEDLRAVFSIHQESVTLIAAVDAGIAKIEDLRDKRVNIGAPGSGERRNAIDVLAAAGIDYNTDLTAESVKTAEAPGLLQEGRIDAFFYTVGHPCGAVKEAAVGARKVRLVTVGGPGIDRLIAGHPYYVKTAIPAALYPEMQNESDVQTFGLKATLVTSVRVPDETVYAITKEVFDNFEEFKKCYPAFAMLTKTAMLEDLSAPIHPGAMKYYKQAGLR
jgi:TRAP transporter TAXI family solute receptor